MQAIRHRTMLPSLQRNEIGTSELDRLRSSILGLWSPCERFTAALAPSLVHRSGPGRLAKPSRGGLPPPILSQLSWRTPKWVIHVGFVLPATNPLIGGNRGHGGVVSKPSGLVSGRSQDFQPARPR